MFILFHHHPVIPSSVLCVKQYIPVRALRTLQYLKNMSPCKCVFSDLSNNRLLGLPWFIFNGLTNLTTM